MEYTDRYKALGVPYPNPDTMCKGQCEGLGVYPQFGDDPTMTAEERAAWTAAHNAEGSHPTGDCDNWHFITCPDCKGSGLQRKE
jgi:hypothetical protein